MHNRFSSDKELALNILKRGSNIQGKGVQKNQYCQAQSQLEFGTELAFASVDPPNSKSLY